MENRFGGETVVTFFYGDNGNLDLEITPEDEVLEIQYFVVFLDGLGPNRFAELDSLRGNLYGRRLEKFIHDHVRVHVPLVRNDDIDGHCRRIRERTYGVIQACFRRRHGVHVELFRIGFANK